MLDQEMGWDDQGSSDWADNSGAEKQEDHFPYFQTEQNDALGETMADCDQGPPYDAQKYLGNGRFNSSYEPSGSLEDEDVTSAEMQRTIWDAAVEESRSAASVGVSTDSLYEDDDDLARNSAAHQQQRQEGEEEVHDERRKKEEEQFQPKSRLEEYIYHRFGPDLNYEDRYWCHEHLHDSVEDGKQYKREYFARAGTVLIKDPCVLLPYPQEDIPGTEDANKPVLMITTPEGEALFPHDVEKYPEPAAATWHGPKLGWGGRTPPQGERYVVPYEDEDGADI